MVTFCLATGYTPEQYYRLTLEQENAFIKELNRQAKRR